jgi:hypothetical protein
LLRNFHFFAMPVTQNQKQERPALKALEVDFIHGAKAGPIPQGEHLPQWFLQ